MTTLRDENPLERFYAHFLPIPSHIPQSLYWPKPTWKNSYNAGQVPITGSLRLSLNSDKNAHSVRITIGQGKDDYDGDYYNGPNAGELFLCNDLAIELKALAFVGLFARLFPRFLNVLGGSGAFAGFCKGIRAFYALFRRRYGANKSL